MRKFRFLRKREVGRKTFPTAGCMKAVPRHPPVFTPARFRETLANVSLSEHRPTFVSPSTEPFASGPRSRCGPAAPASRLDRGGNFRPVAWRELFLSNAGQAAGWRVGGRGAGRGGCVDARRRERMDVRRRARGRSGRTRDFPRGGDSERGRLHTLGSLRGLSREAGDLRRAHPAGRADVGARVWQDADH